MRWLKKRLVPPKGCPYYGHYLSLANLSMVPQHGNQCALMTDAHSPCVYDPNPDWDACELFNRPEKLPMLVQLGEKVKVYQEVDRQIPVQLKLWTRQFP